jgi:predicted histidine transporter YuiF (NhaC family)
MSTAARRAEGGACLETAFGLWGGPLAWYVQLCCGYALASQPCFSGGRRLAAPVAALQWTWAAMVLLVLAAVVTALLSLLVSWRAYRRTRDQTSTDPHELVDAGAGRARFVALWGMLLGGGFALATAVTAVAFITLPRCAG